MSNPYDELDITRDILRDTRGVVAIRLKVDHPEMLYSDGDILIARPFREGQELPENGATVAIYIPAQERVKYRKLFRYSDQGIILRTARTETGLGLLCSDEDEYLAHGEYTIRSIIIAAIRHV